MWIGAGSSPSLLEVWHGCSGTVLEVSLAGLLCNDNRCIIEGPDQNSLIGSLLANLAFE